MKHVVHKICAILLFCIRFSAAYKQILQSHGRGSFHAVNLTPASETPGTDDLTCLKNTGGTCLMFHCRQDRGPTACVDGRCMCIKETCADARGVCVQRRGRWLGEHAFKFVHPYDPGRPYVSVDLVKASGHNTLMSSPDANPAWKVALTPGGRVRFESLSLPGHAMSLYENRRRRSQNFLLATKAKSIKSSALVGEDQTSNDEREKKMQEKHVAGVSIPDNDDIWPIAVPIKDASPIDVTFQVRPTAKDGGGFEIWDPQRRYALSSGNPKWMLRDLVAAKGVAECREALLGGCEGRQLVKFEPALPIEATPVISRADIVEMSNLNWWQYLLVVAMILACCFLPCAIHFGCFTWDVVSDCFH